MKNGFNIKNALSRARTCNVGRFCAFSSAPTNLATQHSKYYWHILKKYIFYDNVIADSVLKLTMYLYWHSSLRNPIVLVQKNGPPFDKSVQYAGCFDCIASFKVKTKTNRQKICISWPAKTLNSNFGGRGTYVAGFFTNSRKTRLKTLQSHMPGKIILPKERFHSSIIKFQYPS